LFTQNNYYQAFSSQDARKSSEISPQDLLESLDIDTAVIFKDVQEALKTGPLLSRKEQDRCNAIIQHPRLVEWLRQRYGGLLLINGSSKAMNATTSATSLIAAYIIDIVETVAERGSVYCTAWFCGQHRSVERDPDASVPMLLCNLIGQLITQCRDFRNFCIKPFDLESVKKGDVDGLCDILEEFSDHMPRCSLLICIIDWISCIDDYDRHDDLACLVERLRQMSTKPSSRGLVFKVLLTNPGGGFQSMRAIPKKDMLIMPDYIIGTGLPPDFPQMVIKEAVEDASGIESEDKDDY